MKTTASTELYRLGLLTALCYTLLLFPTVLILIHSFQSGIPLSHLVETAWHWPIGKFSPKVSTILWDVGLYSMIGTAAYLYIRGFNIVSSAPERSFRPRTILLFTFIFCLLQVAIIPFGSKDLYGYINRGAQQAFYGINPYLTPLGDMLGWRQDLMFHSHWLNNPCPYGFFFAWLAKMLCLLSGHHFFIALILFKALNLFLHLGTAWLVYILGCKLKINRPELGLYLYAWNPLMLFQYMGNGHNDLLLAFPLMLSIWAALTPGRSWLSLPLLMVSVLTKFASLLVFPFLIVQFWKHKKWNALSIGSFLAAVTAFLFAWPYISRIQNFPYSVMLENAGLNQHSLADMLYRSSFYLAFLFPSLQTFVEPYRTFLKPVLWLTFTIYYLRILLRFGRDSTNSGMNRLCRDLVSVLTVMLVFISPKFHAWYLGMVFPLSLLLDEQALFRRFLWLLTLVQLASFTGLNNLHVGNYILLTLLPFLWVIKTRSQTVEPIASGSNPNVTLHPDSNRGQSDD